MSRAEGERLAQEQDVPGPPLGHGGERERVPCVLVDDVRRFVDDRPCLAFRTSAEAVAGLRALAERGAAIGELWLDHDLGGEDTIRPVLALLDELDYEGRRLLVDRVTVITSNPVGANVIRLALERLGYRQDRLYGLRGLLTAYPR